MSAGELVLHPVRLRIVHAVFDGAEFTTGELLERLPDIARPTVYRQVALLADGGVLEVVGEDKVRGALERRYRLRHHQAVVDDETAAGMSADDHQRAFGAAVAVLLAEFGTYLAQPGARPHADQVSYRQFPLWLDDAEKTRLVEDLVAVIAPRLRQQPTAGRRRHLLSTVFFPTEPDPASGPG